MEKPLVIGGWIVPKNKIREIENEIQKIKKRHGIKSLMEVKWTKIEKSKINAYKELVHFALNNENMKLRVLIAKNKKNINLDYKD